MRKATLRLHSHSSRLNKLLLFAAVASPVFWPVITILNWDRHFAGQQEQVLRRCEFNSGYHLIRCGQGVDDPSASCRQEVTVVHTPIHSAKT